jgi:hypothetical protein
VIFDISGKDILPYLPTLMDRLLTALQTSPSNRVKELSISAIAATGEHFKGCFHQNMVT